MNLALVFFCCMATHSAIEAPKPKPEHRFYDRPAKLELALAITATATDNGQACWNFSQGGREYFLPAQSCAGIVAISTADLAAQELLAYIFHRTHHHVLERMARFITIGSNINGLIRSKRHGAF